ncbi:MAG TPA: TetR family transcriptional regulator [Acidimicrobiales bacterium]|nr:TetR family transcriptional regulator [Acidimicrobiales bacterium]
MERPAPASGLTARQQERRDRILDAALELASEGGYEAVQMRDVAARASVALGTLYRYFASKDHLLAAAWARWAGQLGPRIMSRPLRGATMAEQATDFYHRATRAFEREPRLASAVLQAAVSTDASAAESQAEVSALVGRIVMSVMEGLDPVRAAGVRDVLNHVWYSSLLQWVGGRYPVGRVYESLQTAAHLLLDPPAA